jgi:hypothetical protein
MFSRTSAVLMILMSAVPCCTSARASITAFWQPVTITPAAISNDPALANMQSWDLMVTTTGDWGDAFMWADLPAPYVYYKHANGGLTRPNPSLFGMFPALEFTTYVSSPSDDGLNQTTLIGGGHPQAFPRTWETQRHCFRESSRWLGRIRSSILRVHI